MLELFLPFFISSFCFATNPYSNSVKDKLKVQKSSIGGYVSIADAKIVENLALPRKLDFLWIEALQNDLSVKDVQNLVIASENEGLLPFVRVPSNDPNIIKKYLGTGVAGVIVPGVRSKEDAEKALSALKYPPEGKRPPGVERANRYMGRLAEYMASANKQILVILTVDNGSFVENIDSITDVKGIDVIHIGPLHLSSDMGVPIDSGKLLNAVRKIETVAKAKNIPLGRALQSIGDIKQLNKDGYYFFTAPGDMELLRNGIQTFFGK